MIMRVYLIAVEQLESLASFFFPACTQWINLFKLEYFDSLLQMNEGPASFVSLMKSQETVGETPHCLF